MADETNDLGALQAEVQADVEALCTKLSNLGQLVGDDTLLVRTWLTNMEGVLSRPPPLTGGQKLWNGIRGLVDFLLKLLPVATPLVIFWVGFALKDSVDQSLDLRRVEIAEQRLDLEAIQAMENLLNELRVPDIDAERAEALALQIGVFGQHAIVPLIMELDLDRTVKQRRIDAVKHAIRMMALQGAQRRKICAVIVDALGPAGKGSLFQRDGLVSITELAREIPCPAALKALGP